ncbi:MAG TPA: TPM domain-containing protein, partial [Vicinamibacterales bacterium]|nr:TPM domain-containing protein [Vicinamibacterales bacterium]
GFGSASLAQSCLAALRAARRLEGRAGKVTQRMEFRPFNPSSVLKLTACLLLPAALAAQTSFPKPVGRVTDLAELIDPSTEAVIDQQLAALERRTSAEVAVATVRSLDGMSIEEYANRLFKVWGIGQAKQDNGVLVLVALNEREMRIEVGYGLEGVLPDGLAGQIIREEFTPRFRNDDYSGGIRAGVTRVAAVVERHQILTPEELARFNESGGGDGDAPVWIIIPFMGLFVGIGFFMVGAGLKAKAGFPLLFGGFFGGMPLVMGLGIVFWTAVATLLPLAVGMAVLGFRKGKRSTWRGQGAPASGWVMGDNSANSDSSSSSSSSDSFGGGSSGGGGASGRW